MENLIYDRTQTDVNNDTSKSYYNYNDYNRIEKWCEYLADTLNSYNYSVNINVKTNWNRKNFPSESEMERIRQNVNRLKEAYFSFTQIPKNLEYMTIEQANDIEKILYEIDYILAGMENNFVYCGVAGCGQDRVWQQRFRKPKTWISQPYKLSQYADTDTLKMIATESNKSIKSSTEILGLAEIDKRDDVFASIQAINDSMQTIDDLVGYECVYYTLTNLCPAIDGANGFNIGGGSANAIESSTTHTKYSEQSLKFIGSASHAEVYATSTTKLPLNSEHIYYARLEAYQEVQCGGMEIYFPVAEPKMFNLTAEEAGKWNMYSTVIDRSSFTSGDYTFRLDFNHGSVDSEAWYDGWMIIDLTEAFGSGNEPTQDWCDANIPYFSGTRTIKIRKESA